MPLQKATYFDPSDSLYLSMLGAVIVIGCQVPFLSALLVFFTLQLRAGGTIAAVGIWMANIVAGSVLLDILRLSDRLGSFIMPICVLGVPYAIAAFFLFRSAHRLAERRAAEG
jgi:hypothetical protein